MKGNASSNSATSPTRKGSLSFFTLKRPSKTVKSSSKGRDGIKKPRSNNQMNRSNSSMKNMSISRLSSIVDTSLRNHPNNCSEVTARTNSCSNACFRMDFNTEEDERSYPSPVRRNGITLYPELNSWPPHNSTAQPVVLTIAGAAYEAARFDYYDSQIQGEYR